VGPLVGGPPAAPGRPLRVGVLAAHGGPLLAGMGLEIEWAELIDADHHGRVAPLRFPLPIGDGVELEDAVLLGLEIGIVGFLPGLHGLKADALLAEEHAQTL